MKILYVGRRDKNHSKNGGYDHIVKKPGADYLDGEKTIYHYIPDGLPGRGILIYSYLFFVALLKKNQYDIIHFFYGDFMLFFRIPQKCRAKFVATIHLDSSNLTKRKVKILKSFYKVIVLCKSEEIKLLEQNINAIFIPHGFNSPLYKVNSHIEQTIDNKKIFIFFAGKNYRDISTFMLLADYCQKEKKNIIFHAIGQDTATKKKLANLNNVIIYDRLNDNDYYSLLNYCDYNFLPLLFATANNALLEAQSLGTTSILPKITGVDDYACTTENIFYNDINELKQIFFNLTKTGKNKKLIEFSKLFLWDNIFKLLDKEYS